MKVVVQKPFQVTHEGADYRPGDKADVPDAVARHWLVSGWVDAADAASKRAKADLAAGARITDPTDEFGNSIPGDAEG
jgi:hypothetical protein